MQYREFGKLGIKASAFGLGCMRFPMVEEKDEKGETRRKIDEAKAIEMIRYAIDNGVNYVDTAYVYSDGTNEKLVGKALRNGYRERVYLATKLPTWNCNVPEDMMRLFEEQCRNLETERIDFYLVHALNAGSWKKMKDLGVLDFLTELKAKGRIRFACFSFHDKYEVFEEILNSYDWDMCQLQYNFMDVYNQAGTRGVELAASKGIPVVVMEGLLGGKLAKAPSNVQALYDGASVQRSPAEWGFRWLCHQKGIATVLSGVTDMEQTRDNLRIFSEATVGCMTEEEMQLMDRVREAYLLRTKAGCTGCRYCVPCPLNVDIPGIFRLWNEAYQYDLPMQGNRSYMRRVAEGKGADLCVSCRRCEGLCPQKLPISELLAKAHAEMKVSE